MPVFFQIENSRTSILGASPHILGILDYALRYPTQLAEAKESGIVLPTEEAGWDGWVRFLHTPKTKPPWFPTGLIYQAAEEIWKVGEQVQILDGRTRPETGLPEPTVQISLRDYQEEAVQALLQAGRGVVWIPPRGGKTRLMCEVHRRLALPTLWIAPTDRIVRQTYNTIEGFFGRNYAYHLVGAKEAPKAFNRQVVVCTNATAAIIPKEHFQKIQVLITDEFHHAASNTVKNIFGQCDHVYYRFGMTGTFFRSGSDDMAMHALLSRAVYRITSQQLLERGHLVPVHTVFIPVLSPRLRGLDSGTFITGHGKHGVHEHNWRNQLVAQVTFKLIEDSRKILILVGTKKQGYIIRDILRAYLPERGKKEFHTVEFISTDVARPKQTKILESFEDGTVRVLIGTSLLGEGVDMPSADALVYARGEKAEVSLTQNMFRVATATAGKRNAVVVDFIDRHNAKLERHSKERARIYFDEPIFDVTVLQDPGEFPRWLSRQ